MAGTIIIPLSYGENVDWLRNILTQGNCEFFYGGERFVAVDPEVIESATAFELLPEERRKLFERFKLEKFLRMHLAECGVDMGNVSFNCSSSKID